MCLAKRENILPLSFPFPFLQSPLSLLLSLVNLNLQPAKKKKKRELERFSHFDAARYTRNLLALDEKFSLLLICWSEGQSS